MKIPVSVFFSDTIAISEGFGRPGTAFHARCKNCVAKIEMPKREPFASFRQSRKVGAKVNIQGNSIIKEGD
ncbi:MAG: hypothetical protein CL569_12680 [Alphaproteobacteria bacterium]|nr:hypothetical protein [Alphaproteobacteria bacterium]|tara:strand:- start:84 stop:296 length:213 start_codon:yes stop_codon:yes gene_type:complete